MGNLYLYNYYYHKETKITLDKTLKKCYNNSIGEHDICIFVNIK